MVVLYNAVKKYFGMLKMWALPLLKYGFGARNDINKPCDCDVLFPATEQSVTR